MDCRHKVGNWLEIKRPAKSNLKKTNSNPQLAPMNDETETYIKTRTFVRNSSVQSGSKKNKYKKSSEKKASESQSSVKKIAQEYEKKLVNTIVSRDIKRTFERSKSECVHQTNLGTNEQSVKDIWHRLIDSRGNYSNEAPSTENTSDLTANFEEIKKIVCESYNSNERYTRILDTEEQSATKRREKVGPFVVTNSYGEKEKYRNSVAAEEEIDIAVIKPDGFKDEDENPIIEIQNNLLIESQESNTNETLITEGPNEPTQSFVKTLKMVYDNNFIKRYIKPRDKNIEQQSVIKRRKKVKSFVEAENDEEKEKYRKSLVEEMDAELALMKLDGFIDEDENPIIEIQKNIKFQGEKDLVSDLIGEHVDVVEDATSITNDLYASVDDYVSDLPFTSGEIEGAKKTCYDFDDFSESLGDDLENGSFIVEAYNDIGRELVIAQISIDRKVVNLDSAQSIRDAIQDSELVFYESEQNEISRISSTSNGSYKFDFHENTPEHIYEKVQVSPALEDNASSVNETSEPEYFEVFYDPDSKRSTMYSVVSNDSSVYDEDDEGISLHKYDDSVYNNVRRETFCDDKGIIRIERVGYPDNLNQHHDESFPGTSSLSRNNSLASTKKLSYIIDEMKTTEKKYVRDLGKVVNKYIPYITKHTPPHLSGWQGKLFGNIPKIYRKQKRFLVALDKCEEDADEIAKCFMDFETLFNLYPLYLKNKSRADMLLREFTSIIKQMQDEYEERLDFSAYLLTPLQRLGKYILFLENIQKELKKLELNTGNTEMALETVKSVMTRGNDSVAIESIENSPISKLDYGSFIMREKFNVIKPRRLECMVFLFSNVIVFTLIEQKNVELFNYCDRIKMNDLRIATFEDGTIHLTDFTKGKKKHNTARYTYVLEAKSEKIRHTWREAIEDILWKQLVKAKENTLKIGSTLEKKSKDSKSRSKSSSSGSSIFYVD